MVANNINTSRGSKLYPFTSSKGFSQLINEPTHVQIKSSSCIDLNFTDQLNLIMNTGVQVSLHPNCHRQIVHSSFNLNICHSPPLAPLYQRKMWDYKKTDSSNIKKSLIQ